MKKGARLLLPLIAIAALFFGPSNISAHPGNTAADGCHYCRTNCDKWGVAEDERHCHNAPAYVSPATAQPTQVATPQPKPVKTAAPKTPSPTPIATVAPTAPSPTPQEIDTKTVTPSTEPEVMSLTTSMPVQTAADQSEATSGDALTGLGILAVIIGVPIIIGKRIVVKIRN